MVLSPVSTNVTRQGCTLLVYPHAVVAHVKRDVGHVQKIIGKVLFDDVALVATADDEVIDPMMGVNLHDVPKDGFSSQFNHGLWLEMRLFRDSSSKASSKDDCFHRVF